MRNFTPLLFIALIWMGCSLDEETVSLDPNLSLLFSNDTVTFDTLLSARRSSTQRLTVYNPNSDAIQITEIALGKQQSSDYSVIINGRETTSLANERILGGDSLIILVEVNVNPRNEDLPYLVKDSIVFKWNTNEEHVKLVAYGQDGNLVSGTAILCNETWTNDRPTIISDSVIVSPGCQLTIEKGARVFFENDAVMFIQGTLKAIGDSADHIVFTSARFDGIYDAVPGQWDGIYFLEGSAENEIAYTEIFNGQVGLRVGTPDDDDIPDVIVNNSQIFNMSLAGILAFTSDVQATNTLIHSCGTYLVGGFAGGNYTFRHCTLANDPQLFLDEDATVQFSDNLVVGEDELLVSDLNLEIVNSIIWGQRREELLINNGGETQVTAIISNNIIKSESEITGNFTSRENNFPGFTDLFLNDYSLDTLAFAKDKGVNIGVDDDITGRLRDDLPDIGAYERIEEN